MPDKKILLKSLSAQNKPSADTAIIKKTIVGPNKLEEDPSIDSTYLGKRRTNFMMSAGRPLTNANKEEVGRAFHGIGDYEGKLYVIHKGNDYAQELSGKGTFRNVDLKELHGEHQAAIKNKEAEGKYDAAKFAERQAKLKELDKPMSEENVSKLATSLKSMKKP